jgi:hypothetical protein
MNARDVRGSDLEIGFSTKPIKSFFKRHRIKGKEVINVFHSFASIEHSFADPQMPILVVSQRQVSWLSMHHPIQVP